MDKAHFAQPYGSLPALADLAKYPRMSPLQTMHQRALPEPLPTVRPHVVGGRLPVPRFLLSLALKLLVVQVHDHANKPKEQYVVAVDAVGAGPGDVVLYASGSSARQTTITKDKPCDAVIMAIVDSWDVDGKNVYEKWS